MPSLAQGIVLFTGEAQEQPVLLKSDVGGHMHGHVELSKSPKFTNFFKENEVEQDQLANRVQMVGLLQTAQRLQDLESQALRKVEMSLWNRKPIKVDDAHNFSFHIERKSLDRNRKVEASEEEDRKQLGMLLSMPVSRPNSPGRAAEKKRSLSRMLEPEELDPELRKPRSHTPSESGEETQLSAGAARVRSPLKIQKTEGPAAGIDKDLLSLSLPVSNSSMNSESSSSSQERDAQLQTVNVSAFAPFKSLRIHPASGNDGAQSNKKKTPTNSSVPFQIEDRTMTHQADSGDDAAGDTSTPSSSEPLSPEMQGADEPEFQLTLQWDSLKANAKTLDGKRSKFSPLTCAGLDAQALNQQNLLLRDLDTGLETHGLQLVNLLLKCAEATAQRNVKLAGRILGELYQGASLYGDSMQRVAAYFAEGLAARIVSKDSPMYSNLMVQPSTEQYCAAFTTLYKVAPYFQFAHFTANQAIVEAVEGHKFVHVIDLDIMQGFQWPSLIQALASREGGPPQLRITGVGEHANIVRETGRRLTSFATSFGVPFEFHAVVEEKLENLTPEVLAPRFGEAIAVNAVLQLHRLLNPTSGENLHKFMHTLCRRLNPRVVTLVEQEANHNAQSFLGRFMEALHYYAAVFDSLDACLPQQNEERVKVEQFLFAPQIKNIVVSDGNERVERHETFDLWQQRMEMAGFFRVPLSAHAISQAKLLLQFSSCEGYRLHERNGSICLGWQERQLLTASAWSC